MEFVIPKEDRICLLCEGQKEYDTADIVGFNTLLGYRKVKCGTCKGTGKISQELYNKLMGRR